MTNTKILTRKKPELHARGKIKRTGATYYEAWYWNGSHWKYKEFAVRKDAKEFLEQFAR